MQDFKDKFEMKSQIDEETQKIILNKDIDKIQDDFEKQFYKLLNDDDEKKGLHEYFYVLQQKILKLKQENEELTKYKKNIMMKEKHENNNNIFTQLIQLDENNHKRNHLEYTMGKKGCINNNKNFGNNSETNKIINDKNIIKDNNENKRPVNAIKLKNNNNSIMDTEFRKIFNNPFRRKELTFQKKNNSND